MSRNCPEGVKREHRNPWRRKILGVWTGKVVWAQGEIMK